jgi:hypothetical protein
MVPKTVSRKRRRTWIAKVSFDSVSAAEAFSTDTSDCVMAERSADSLSLNVMSFTIPKTRRFE